MSAQMVPEDGSALSRLDQALFRLEKLLALLAGVTILFVMLISVANILGRKLFNIPVPGFVDWMEQSVPIIAFLGIVYCQRLGGHIRMDILIGQLRGRLLYAAEWFGVLLLLALSVTLIWGSWLHFARSFDFGAPLWSRDSTIDLSLPTWPVKLVVPVMLFLLAVRLGLQLWAYGRAWREEAEVPVAVPLIETPAQQAEREAGTVSGLSDDNGADEADGRNRT
ncbi:TRAP transporter small permease [Nitratireductor mangrovi]|uniref:TRAP transporter small permease protein n=1 Tax=Nitratireductor mangrovi TaxID=2599600 RepID=A0A5B8KYN2_9HYPH|nr:TRAP transporter small permease [Nitratireductor mangrovi]QDZ00671.1 TRAP transporter small permease [Nitratireductor mangrovi]